MDLKKIFEYALQREREGLAFFTGHAKTATHATAAGIFKRLATEEEQHVKYVEGLLAGLAANATVEAPALAKDGFFAGRAEKELLAQSVTESMVPDLAVLRVAFLIERDLAEFYETAAARAAGPAHAALTQLANWERAHERLFRNLHDQLFAQYTDMPWGG